MNIKPYQNQGLMDHIRYYRVEPSQISTYIRYISFKGGVYLGLQDLGNGQQGVMFNLPSGTTKLIPIADLSNARIDQAFRGE